MNLKKMTKDKIKTYQGGSTGLVQQKGIRSNKKKVKSSYILKDIKDDLKNRHKLYPHIKKNYFGV